MNAELGRLQEAECEPKMVPTVILNPYFSSSWGFQLNHAIEKHKKRVVCGLGFYVERKVYVSAFNVSNL